jgi:hypothetical protein
MVILKNSIPALSWLYNNPMFTPRVHAGKWQTYRIKIEKTTRFIFEHLTHAWKIHSRWCQWLLMEWKEVVWGWSPPPSSWIQYGDSKEFVRTKLTKFVLLSVFI